MNHGDFPWGNMRHLRKLGFGFGASDDRTDPESWLESQLTTTFPQLGYAEVEAMERNVVAWPNEYSPDLNERVRRILAFVEERQIVLESDASAREKEQQERAVFDRYETRYYDQVRFLQAPLLEANHFRLRLSHFWLNHFTVGLNTLANLYLIGSFAKDAIYDQLDGSFADMFYKASSHPAMLTYLDNIHNVGENSEFNRRCGCAGLNDNLARELMELHSVSPSRGYTEDDIRDAAKILAGWGSSYENDLPEPISDHFQAYFRTRAEPGEKTVLGSTFGPGPGTLRELTDHLAADPMTAEFLSRKLALHFVGDAATEDEIAAIRSAWLDSEGDLPTVHRAVANVALNSESRKFLWPMTWLSQLVRISDSRLCAGFAQFERRFFTDATRMPGDIMDELGMNFWSSRQPNGFSDQKVDWVSSEHFERRIRFAQILFRYGNPRRSVDDMVDILQPSEATKATLTSATSREERFVLLACSKDFFEV